MVPGVRPGAPPPLLAPGTRPILHGVAPALVHVAPHPDDEAVGCPGALLHLKDRGWTIVSVIASLGFEAQWARRRAEAEEASTRAGFVPVFLDPPLNLDLDGDLDAATARVADELPAIVDQHQASIVVSPSPHDVHHGHEAVGRGVQRALGTLPDSVRWWMWGVWGDLPAPNVFYAYDQSVLDRALHILDAYGGRAGAQRLPAVSRRAGRRQRRHGLRAGLRLRRAGRHHPSLCRPPHRGAAARRTLHGLRGRTSSTRGPSRRPCTTSTSRRGSPLPRCTS